MAERACLSLACVLMAWGCEHPSLDAADAGPARDARVGTSIMPNTGVSLGPGTAPPLGAAGRPAPLEPPDGSPAMPVDAGGASSPAEPTANPPLPPLEEPAEVEDACSDDGALRCDGTGGAGRERCDGDTWVSADACADGEICDVANEDEPGTCVSALELCRGSEGELVCQGPVLHTCGAGGASLGQTACASERHCEVGRPLGACATCLPGEFQCDGTSLTACQADGSGFAPSATCDTAALCNETAGACTDRACLAGGHRCEGDMLQECNADQTAYVDKQMCDSGRCDVAGEQCDKCIPNRVRCDENEVVTCDAAGQAEARSACGGSTPYCIGTGTCVGCRSSSDCSGGEVCDPSSNTCVDCLVTANCGGDPGTCKRFSCQAKTCTAVGTSGGSCSTSGGFAGTCASGSCRCTPDCAGKCSGSDGCGGSCPDNCSGGDVCDTGSDACVECLTASDCRGNPGTCKRFSCSGKRCSTAGTSGGSCITSNGSAGRCESGSCACTRSCSGKCGGPDGCGGTCPDNCSGSRPACHPGTNSCVACVNDDHCSGGDVCSNNQCVECQASGDCDKGQECRANACRTAIENCASESQCSSTGDVVCTVGGAPGICLDHCEVGSICIPHLDSSWSQVCFFDFTLSNFTAGVPSCMLRCRTGGGCPNGYSCVTQENRLEGDGVLVDICWPDAW